MYQDIEICQLADKAAGVPIFDLRSPMEYEEATIPGSYNIPLLDNLDRALVGTVYKNNGAAEARELAIEILAPKLPALINSFQKIAPDKKVVVFCWRGGERSRFAGSILTSMGFQVYRINGGFKAYRNAVREYLDKEFLPLRAVVVHGLTGVGKTNLLIALKEMGYPVIDLEGQAKHRGSVFGKIGQPPSPGQKMFEALIERELRAAEPYGIFVVECESRRLGNLYVPASLLKNMQQGYRVLLHAPFNSRVKRIFRDYVLGGPGSITALQDAVTRLAKSLGKNQVTKLNQQLAMGNFEEVFGFLLEKYYDPLYKYPDGPSEQFDLSVNTEDMIEAAQKVSDFITCLPEYNILGRQ